MQITALIVAILLIAYAVVVKTLKRVDETISGTRDDEPVTQEPKQRPIPEQEPGSVPANNKEGE